MAIMYPAELPAEIRMNPKHSGEARIYDQLKKLPAEYIVFYGVELLSKPFYAENTLVSPLGEADFIIIHQNYGLITVEVKGGKITVENGNWQSTDRNNITHKIKDPFVQSRENSWRVKKSLEQYKGIRINPLYAVIFPDSYEPRERFSMNGSHEITVYSNDLVALKNRIDSIFLYWKDVYNTNRYGNKLSNREVEEIIGLMAPNLDFGKPKPRPIVSKPMPVQKKNKSHHKLLAVVVTVAIVVAAMVVFGTRTTTIPKSVTTKSVAVVNDNFNQPENQATDSIGTGSEPQATSEYVGSNQSEAATIVPAKPITAVEKKPNANMVTEENIGKMVLFTGTVVDSYSDAGNIFVVVAGDSTNEQITVPIFKSLKYDVSRISVGANIAVRGEIYKFKNKMEVVPQRAQDITIK